jgi:uncharacterized protein YjbI with pentapeptide repeats
LSNEKSEHTQDGWQSSWQFKAIEWLKGIAGLAAILGFFATVWFTSQQLSQLTASRDEDRFDKAISRLSSTNPSERLTGVAGLQLFLGGTQRKNHLQTLLFLANALAVEKDPTISQSILDTFVSLKQSSVEQEVLDQVLIVERDRNRAIIKNLREQFEMQVNNGSAKLLEVPDDELGFGTTPPSEVQPLQATGFAIAALIRAGARVKDLSSIYCISCNFSSHDGATDLSNVDFDNSYLRDADFSRCKLENASFDGAYLIHTNFTGSDMQRARLTDQPLTVPPIQAILHKHALWGAFGPIFECADLTNADFSGNTLFGFYWSSVNGVGYFPRFFGANLSGAKMSVFTIFAALPRRFIKEKSALTDTLPFGTLAAGRYGISVGGWDEKQNSIITYEVGPQFKFTGQIPSGILRSVIAGFNSLASAKNLDKADIPRGIEDFIAANPKFFAKPIISTQCEASATP